MKRRPLDTFLRDHVQPLLKEKGFVKKDRNFRRFAPNGDMVYVSFRSWMLEMYEVEFHVRLGVQPRPWAEWNNRRHGLPTGSIVSPIWERMIFSPFTYLPYAILHDTQTWLFNLDDTDRITVFLDRLSAAVDEMSLVADRHTLLSMARNRSVPPAHFFPAQEYALAALLVDEGPSRELDEVLRALDAKDPNDEMASWVRAKLAAGDQGSGGG